MNKRLVFVFVALMAVPVALLGQEKPLASSAPPREPDYRERKRFLLVCEQRGSRRSAENAGRKLLLQADTGGAHFWPARWPCGRRFVHVLFASHR